MVKRRNTPIVPALKTLLETLGGDGVLAVNDPAHTDAGGPGLHSPTSGCPIGHVECKDIGDDLSKTEQSEQLRRYRDALPNLILTDYLEFRWYTYGQLKHSGRLGSLDSKGNVPATPKGRRVLYPC